LEILNNIKSSLNIEEQVIFFFFFAKNSSELFHSDKVDINKLLSMNRTVIREIIDLDKNVDFELADRKILEIWNNYVKGNTGKSANYFGIIALHLVKLFLQNSSTYNDIEREAKIFLRNKPIHNDYIDIVGKSLPICDLYESKHAIYPQRDKIPVQMDKLRVISKELINNNFKSKSFLATIEFIKKENIKFHDPNLSTDEIINGEDIFSIPIKTP
jgi:hypothetical protein